MIAYIRGKLLSAETDAIIVDVGGLGYRLQVPGTLVHGMPPAGSEVQLHTQMVVREDAIHLYGFRDQAELECFRYLLNVGGVGPKGALAVLSFINPGTLRQVVAQENVSLLTKVPGVGKKTAQRIILELKDKMNKIAPVGTENVYAGEVSGADEALEALLALGYSRMEALTALNEAKKTMSPEQGEKEFHAGVIRRALQWLGNKGANK